MKYKFKSPMNQTKAFIILSFICIGYVCNSQFIKQRGSESEDKRVQGTSFEIEEATKTKISQKQGKQDNTENQINGNEEKNIQKIQDTQWNLNLKNNAIKRNIRVSLNEDSLLIISPPVAKNQDSQQNKTKQASQAKKVPKKKKKSKKSKKSRKNKDKDIKNDIINVSAPQEKKKQPLSEQIKQVVENVSLQKEQPIFKVKQKIQEIVQKKVEPKIQLNKIESKTSETTSLSTQNIQKKENSQIGKNVTNIPILKPIQPEINKIEQAAPIILNQAKIPEKENEIENENDRMQRQKVIQQQIKTQEQLKKARDQIIFRRQQQIKKLQAQAKRRAEQNKPVQMVELKPYYCGPQIYQNRRKNLPQPVPNSRQRLVQTVYGFSMYVDSKDYMVSNSITASGTWQPGYINLIGHLVKPGNNVINLGSQSGLEALIMGKIVGKNGKLFIFEPYSFSNNLITKNIALNNLQDITTIYKYGASDEKTTATIQIAYSNTGGSQIVPKQTNAVTANNPYRGFNEVQQVQIDRVDALLPKDISLDFALLDVEKMEIKAMKGMKQIIERSPNLVIMTEWQYGQNPRRNRQETIQFLNYMIGREYKIYSYTGGNIVNCSVGQFHEYPNIQVLLGINFIDIFFFPKGYVLPK